MKTIVAVCPLVLMLCVLGCGSSDDDAGRYQFSTVTKPANEFFPATTEYYVTDTKTGEVKRVKSDGTPWK